MDQWIDWLLGQLTPAQWDAWRNWLATLGGLVALFIAALTYRRNVKLRREEQARLVYVESGNSVLLSQGDEHEGPGEKSQTMQYRARTPDRIQLYATVYNGSKELIGPIHLEMSATIKADRVKHDGRIWTRIPRITPESSFTVSFVVDNFYPGSVPFFTPTIAFRDASGSWWEREAIEPIRRSHDDEANFGIGGEFSLPRPVRVRLRTRLRRLSRRIRRLRPIPPHTS